MTATPPTPPPFTVLVVDDEAGLRRVLERALGREGYRVLSAGSAESAWEILTAGLPDAVLLDVQLPGTSGLAFYLTIVNRWPELEGVIALMSGDVETESVRAWLEHHRCVVIRKPFNLREVTDWLQAVRRFRSNRRELGNG